VVNTMHERGRHTASRLESGDGIGWRGDAGGERLTRPVASEHLGKTTQIQGRKVDARRTDQGRAGDAMMMDSIDGYGRRND
jgi:hypothetical protein